MEPIYREHMRVPGKIRLYQAVVAAVAVTWFILHERRSFHSLLEALGRLRGTEYYGRFLATLLGGSALIVILLLVAGWAVWKYEGLTVQVSPKMLRLRFGPLPGPGLRFRLDTLQRYRVVSFTPRRWFGTKTGKGSAGVPQRRGVEFEFQGRKRSVVLGSQQPEQLAAAIQTATGLAPAPEAALD